MNTARYKIVEFLIIFILLPVSFVIDYSIKLKMGIGGVGFLYIIYVLLKVEKRKIKIAPDLKWRTFWRQTFFKLVIIAIITTLFVWLTDSKSLFSVLLEKPKLWVFILFIYSFFSVYPQEIVYRTFYFQRYKGFFKSESLFIFVNAIIFSLGHIFFKNNLVLVLTFFGGLLFALTYRKTESTLLVSIEHTIYGCWLFTVGMGSMLGFPA